MISIARRAALAASFFSGLLLVSPVAHALVFAVNEGVTYRVPYEEIRGRYAAIAADMSKILQQPVTVEPIGDYPSLRQGLSEKRYDIAMVHPAHISILAMKNSGYQLLAVTKGFQSYSASFLINAKSPLKSVQDLKGLKLGAPDEDSITSWMVRATLRDVGLKTTDLKIYYTRYQDAVPFFVENELTHSGASAASSVVKNWQAGGGKVLAKSKPVPIKHLIAGPSLTADQVTKLRDYLATLDSTDEGKKKLAPTKWTGFERYDQAAMLELGKWLGL
ncbi:MAG: phosphate/phosphite/phosphonate ABC transporter substrate-binding protein [Burkholderiales bacterium]